MSRWIACLASLLFLLSLPGHTPSADVPQGKDQPEGKKTAPRPPSRWNLMWRLHDVVDLSDFGQVPMSLKDGLGVIQDKVNAAHKGADDTLPILVDSEAFKEENPELPDVYCVPFQFPPFPKKMTVATALRLILVKVPVKAAYLVRGNYIEVTTAKRASPAQLLQEPVLVGFDKTPLSEALEVLSDLTGLSITVDGRVAEKLKTPITASFNNDARVGAVLKMLTDMAELKTVMIDESVYVTSPANAEALEKERKSR